MKSNSTLFENLENKSLETPLPQSTPATDIDVHLRQIRPDKLPAHLGSATAKADQANWY
ncbi:hypothetical protein QG37_06471 [Candidozyma auris]|nr:hypothetical protein QG37_06471 [[Candida] auris]